MASDHCKIVHYISIQETGKRQFGYQLIGRPSIKVTSPSLLEKPSTQPLDLVIQFKLLQDDNFFKL